MYIELRRSLVAKIRFLVGLLGLLGFLGFLWFLRLPGFLGFLLGRGSLAMPATAGRASAAVQARSQQGTSRRRAGTRNVEGAAAPHRAREGQRLASSVPPRGSSSGQR